MIITCKCLNISIDTQGSEIQDIDVCDLDLSVTEQNEKFFKEKFYSVEHGRISKVQSGLVQIRTTGNWIVHCCLNCSTNTHAIHKDKGAALVLVSKDLLTNSDEISALKSSEKYSPVYRILVNHSDNDLASLQAHSKFTVSQLAGAVQTSLGALQQQLAEVVRQEVSHTEERVRQFSELQYAALEEFRERAHRDHRVLARLLCEAQEASTAPTCEPPTSALDGLETPPSTPDNQNVPVSPLPQVLRVTPQSISLSRQSQPSPAAQNASVGNSCSERLPTRLFERQIGSLDAEGLFDLEGMDEHPSEMLHSEDETDTDDSGSHDEGIHIPRSRVSFTSLAKSLPVSVPTFLSLEHRFQDEEQPNEDKLPQEPDDIAASIKALARSVHGDTHVFGDLPRPRFSTQL